MNYDQAVEKLNGKARKKLEYETYLVRKNIGTVAIELFGNEIITYRYDGTTIIDSCGWKTSTTKKRINKYAPIILYQKDFEWYVANGLNEPYDFEDGMTFLESGELLTK